MVSASSNSCLSTFPWGTVSITVSFAVRPSWFDAQLLDGGGGAQHIPAGFTLTEVLSGNVWSAFRWPRLLQDYRWLHGTLKNS